MSGTCGIANSPAPSVIVSFKTRHWRKPWDSSFVLEPISNGNHIIRKKVYLLFSKFKIGNWERGWSQVRFVNTETPSNQFETKLELST